MKEGDLGNFLDLLLVKRSNACMDVTTTNESNDDALSFLFLPVVVLSQSHSRSNGVRARMPAFVRAPHSKRQSLFSYAQQC